MLHPSNTKKIPYARVVSHIPRASISRAHHRSVLTPPLPLAPPAKTVADLQFAVASGRAIMIAAAVTARVLPNGLVRAVEVDRLSPSMIEVAHVRTDRRRVIRDF